MKNRNLFENQPYIIETKKFFKRVEKTEKVEKYDQLLTCEQLGKLIDTTITLKEAADLIKYNNYIDNNNGKITDWDYSYKRLDFIIEIAKNIELNIRVFINE